MIIGVMQTILIQIFDISRSKKKPRICVKSSRELQDALLYVFAATVAEGRRWILDSGPNIYIIYIKRVEKSQK